MLLVYVNYPASRICSVMVTASVRLLKSRNLL